MFCPGLCFSRLRCQGALSSFLHFRIQKISLGFPSLTSFAMKNILYESNDDPMNAPSDKERLPAGDRPSLDRSGFAATVVWLLLCTLSS